MTQEINKLKKNIEKIKKKMVNLLLKKSKKKETQIK